MKKYLAFILCMVMALGMTMTGCDSSSDTPNLSSEGNSAAVSQNDQTSYPSSDVTELVVRFGDDGAPFTMYLEDNSTAAAIAEYVGTTEWRLPVYSYDESDVMEYYDIPSRYEIPDNSATVTQAHAGDVFYSDPNRIVLYYRDAQVNAEYTKVGTFDATEEFISAVENNPVLAGWGNQIVIISVEA